MERKLSIAAACIAAIIAIFMPAGFFAVGYQSEGMVLRNEAHINARLASSIINANPQLWEYEQHRLENLLANRPGDGTGEARTVRNLKGVVVAENRDALEWPLLEKSADIHDSGRKVGSLVVTRSLRLLIEGTAAVALLAVLLAAAVFFSLRVLPLRALRSAVDQLVISREKSLQAEDRLRIANLSQRMLQLELASVEEATRMRSQFLANMSHEIRTPMNAVIGLSQMALQGELDPRQRDCIEKVETAGQHLMGIINDMLDFSSMEAGDLSIESVEFEVESVLDELSHLVRQKSNAKGLELVFEIRPDVPRHLVGDPLRLRQILHHFVDNAVKFTDKGEIVVSVAVEKQLGEQLLVRFSVRDTGIGMSPDVMRELFESFHQGDATATRKYGGTGLGLAISKRLAALMGGEVGVQSDPGKGSVFWFTARLGSASEHAPQDIPGADLLGRRALVADDSDAARTVVTEMLQGMGLNVTGVSSGYGAIAAVQRAAEAGKPVEIVFVDSRMPQLDGLETVRRIRLLALAQPPAIVMMTSSARNQMVQEPRAVGAHEVLVKPVGRTVLFHTAVKALRQRHVVILPLPPAPPPAPPAPPVAAKTQGKSSGGLVLLVEDNDLNQLVASMMLAQAGLAVDIAADGRIAVAMVQKREYDIVLMDMQMPVMDGVQATIAIRKLPGMHSLPIVALTANVKDADRKRCIDAGMNDFVSKPIDIRALRDVLKRWVRPRPQPHAGVGDGLNQPG